MEKQELSTQNLAALRELRIQEKAIKARIDEISTAATNEAVAILAAQGLEKGKFTLEGIGDFVLDKDPIFEKDPEKPFINPKDFHHIESLLKRKKNIILQGPPGVGKTTIATIIAKIGTIAKIRE